MTDKAGVDRPPPPPTPAHGTVFLPDQDGLGEWARATFINDDAPLLNSDHAHLRQAIIGWLWAYEPSEHRGKRLAGECRMPRPAGARWSQMMGEQQLRELFGGVPDFIITIDAELARMAEADQFCALVEHECYHAAQETDAFGAPRFNRDGRPIFTMRGHDVEQFLGVVERYGAAAAGVSDMVMAASLGSSLQRREIELACATCARV